MNPPMYLFLPSFDENKILNNKKKGNLFQRNIKISGNSRIFMKKSDNNLLHDIEFLKKVGKNEAKEPDPTPIKCFSNKKLPIMKPERPSHFKKTMKNELSSTLYVKKIINLTNTSFECLQGNNEKHDPMKNKSNLRSALLRNNINSASLKLINLNNKQRLKSSVVKNTYFLKKIEWEYSNRLKFFEDKGISNFKIRIIKTPNTYRK